MSVILTFASNILVNLEEEILWGGYIRIFNLKVLG
jgi:hypothetical protein